TTVIDTKIRDHLETVKERYGSRVHAACQIAYEISRKLGLEAGYQCGLQSGLETGKTEGFKVGKEAGSRQALLENNDKYFLLGADHLISIMNGSKPCSQKTDLAELENKFIELLGEYINIGVQKRVFSHSKPSFQSFPIL